VKRAQIKLEISQLHEMAAAFGGAGARDTTGELPDSGAPEARNVYRTRCAIVLQAPEERNIAYAAPALGTIAC